MKYRDSCRSSVVILKEPDEEENMRSKLFALSLWRKSVSWEPALGWFAVGHA